MSVTSIEILVQELIDLKPIYKGKSSESMSIRLMESKGIKTEGAIIRKLRGMIIMERDVDNEKIIVYQVV